MKFAFLFLLLFSLTLFAQSRVFPSTNAAVEDAHLANINALLIFTSQNGLNTGLFQFTKVGVDMQIYNLPFRYHYASNTKLNYFLVGNVGYSSVTTTKKILSSQNNNSLDTDTQLQTYTGGLGLGARYRFRDDLSVLGGLELIYSRSGVSIKSSNSNLTTPVGDFFSNNYNDNISYKLLLESTYQPKMRLVEPYFTLGYRFYDTKSDFSYKRLASFNSQSGVFSASMGLQTDSLYRLRNNYLTLEGYLNANYLQGEVVNSIQFDNYYKVGGIAYWYLDDDPFWIKRLFTEVSTTTGDGIEGYNFGLGFSLSY